MALDFTDKRAGKLRVAHFDISPDGTKLVATGTFTKVDGLDRDQIAMIDLSTTPASVSSWQTDAFTPACATRFDTYVRDVSFAPDGSYFVVATPARGSAGERGRPLRLRPAVGERRDRARPAADLGRLHRRRQPDPGRRDRRGVYVGGHQRYLNNPFVGDTAGAGAVSRMGIAALDPENGLPYTWNPGRYPRGSGVWAFLGTAGRPVGRKRHRLRRLRLPPAAGAPARGRREERPGRDPGRPPGRPLHGRRRCNAGAAERSTARPSGPPAAVTGVGLASANIRGAFMLSGQLYLAWRDGHMDMRPFDGTTAGAPKAIDLHGLTAGRLPVSKLTGMFFTDGRLYYTVNGDRHLYWRWFEPQSRIVGAQRFVASGGATGIDWSGVSGITLASGHLYYLRDGTLYAMDFSAGAPVPGTETAVSGAAVGDGQVWTGRGLFVAARRSWYRSLLEMGRRTFGIAVLALVLAGLQPAMARAACPTFASSNQVMGHVPTPA